MTTAQLETVAALRSPEVCASATEALALYAQGAAEAARRWGKANSSAVLAAIVLEHGYAAAEVVRAHLVEAGILPPLGGR